MSIRDFLTLAELLLKFRASFALSHRLRDTIDVIVVECLHHVDALGVSKLSDDTIPF